MERVMSKWSLGLSFSVCVAVLCLAGAAGPVVAEQDLAREGEICGGIAGVPCGEGLWCDPEPGTCGGNDISGTCVSVPQVCTADYQPVCGCDGATYGNDCERRAAQSPLDHAGECGPERKPD